MIGEKELSSLLSGKVNELGYDLSGVKLLKNKDGWTLQVVVDRVEPISLEDIVSVSDALSKYLDAVDPIEDGYMLDVSSLGAEKPIAIEKLPQYEGRYVALHLSHPYQGENNLEGTLVSVKDGTVTLQIRVKAKTKDIAFPQSDVDRARLAIRF